MLSDSRGDLAIAPWLVIGPGVSLVATMAAALLIGDALRDILDPHPAQHVVGRRRHRSRRRATAAAVASDAVPLSINALHVRYPDGTLAVRGVDLEIAAGEHVAIVGESGCGKTTIARAVMAMLPDATWIDGTVTVGGHDLLHAAEAQRRAVRGTVVGYVAQDPYGACDPLQRVRLHVEEPWRAHGQSPPPGDAVSRMDAMGITDAERRLQQRPFRWSGGMLQRATTAAAAVHSPMLMVADEPTSALDTQLADNSLDALDQASDALLLITHDLRLVERHSTRVAVMYAGRVVEAGPTAVVVSAPRHPYSQALLAASPVEGGGPPATLPGTPPSLLAEPVGCPFAPRCPNRVDICAVNEPSLTDGIACWNPT
jgi:oligopeptide/dipeptide ABC transporter ATP-binding protein